MSEPIYTIDVAAGPRREAVKAWLHGLDLVSPQTREAIVTAWVSSWSSSRYRDLADMPFTPEVHGYRLMDHVNDVTQTALDLTRRASESWGLSVDFEILVPILILHDVDKPLLYIREGEGVAYSSLSRALPHGVIGAMLLKELGFHRTVVSTVATHAVNAPFHGSNPEAYLLHYADMFSADHAHIACGRTPFYRQKRS
jgi:hypothetical protein